MKTKNELKLFIESIHNVKFYDWHYDIYKLGAIQAVKNNKTNLTLLNNAKPIRNISIEFDNN